MRLSKGIPWLLVIFASFAPAEAQISLTSDECCPCNEIGKQQQQVVCGYAQIRGVFRVGGIGCNLNFLPHEKPTKIKKKERKQQKSSEKLGKKGKYPNLFFTPGPLSGSERLMQIGIGIGSYKLIVIIL